VSTTLQTVQGQTKKSGSGLYVALAPWIAFSVIAHLSVQAAAVVALVGAIVIAIPSIRRRNPKLLELAAAAAFAGITVAAFLLDASAVDWLARYARGIAAGLLALIAFGSLLFTPFTEQYARESVPRELWGSSRFRALNRTLTAIWGCVFAAMVPCHIIAGQLDTTRASLIFNWALPIVFVMWGLKRTTTLADATSTQG
jgi:hypothetical protein